VSIRRTLSALIALPMIVLLAPSATASEPDGASHLRVPGAERQEVARLPELTTAGTVASGHTNPQDWAGLTPANLPQPSGVPGIQIDGYFPDSSTTNTNHGWQHDSQFVIRLPDNWNGGLVVAGPPGNRRQYANDRAIADWVLAKGYAFAATDKGNTGTSFQHDGDRPGDAIVEWHNRVSQVALAARAVVAQRYGRPPSSTLAAGISNGGYLVRWQLENRPWLFDGGIDWEGTLWTVNGPNLFTFLPPVLRAYPSFAAGGPGREEIVAAGFPSESEFLWDYHYRIYWELTQRIYREELDPSYVGSDVDYDYANRPSAQQAVARIALTGRIGKPLVTFHGTLDTLLPISQSGDVYAQMVRDQGRGRLHSYHRIEGGNHVDGLVDTYPDRLTALAPYFPTALTELEDRLRR
jgi:hypothetical protein